MVKKASIIAVIVAILFSAVVVAGPAQVVLQDLAESEKEARLLLGYGFIGLGVVGGLVTTVALADYGLGEYGLAVGGLLALPGFFSLQFLHRLKESLIGQETLRPDQHWHYRDWQIRDTNLA